MKEVNKAVIDGEKQKITDTLEKNYMPYAMSVIISRAIPEIDGFKPSHRKLLFTMYKMGLIKGNRTKSANIVGQTMKVNPHGDTAIYETMVRLSEGYAALNTPFVDSKGNFGKQYSRDMAYAAARYTEAKLAAIATEIFGEIEENTVEFVDNYDGTMKEPVLLPVRFPNILVNPNQGIAVGMANYICGFNLVEVCNATIELLKDPTADSHQYMLAPDFPSGGDIVYHEHEIRKIFNTGRGSFKLRGKYRYDKKQNCVEIYEIPYNTTIEAIIDKIIDLVKGNKVREIVDVRDETDLSGLRITIDVRRNTDIDILMHKIFASTPLESTVSCNFNILVRGTPKIMGVNEILNEWIDFRVGCIRNKYLYNIDKMESKHHLLLGLEKLLVDIDAAIRIIRETKTEKLVIPNLVEGFSITKEQAEFIAEIRLRNLNQEYILKRIAEIEELAKEINRLTTLVKSDKKIKGVIAKELTQIIKKYGAKRLTQIISDDEIEEISEEDMIEDYNLKVFITEHQYIKKITLASLRGSSEQKTKDDDHITQEIEATNKADLILFSDKQKAYKMKLYELEDVKASDLGGYLPNILELEEDEKIIHIHGTTDYSGFMLFGYKNGKVSKVPLEDYMTRTNRRRLLNAYSDEDECVGICFVPEDGMLFGTRSDGRAVVFDSSLIPTKVNKDARGTQAMKMTKTTTFEKLTLADHLDDQERKKYLTSKIPAMGKII
ncbi:MAG TPA: topoisomerase IV [Epulopiscium sp.]|nr:topoisomerase IV [Candidatus Epulonipiscium sp.]